MKRTLPDSMSKALTILALFLILQTGATLRAVEPTRPSQPPPMGWNSWNFFGKARINETIVRAVIDAMVTSGLRDAGYTYVVIDGGWRDTKLGPDGELLPHPGEFPGGIKPLADYAHSKGLKLGLHTCPGTHDCGGDPVGGFGHEAVQMKQFVDWGIDFIKLDRCRFRLPGNGRVPNQGWTEETTEQGRRLRKDGDTEVWSKKLAGGRRAVLLLNRHARTLPRPWAAPGAGGRDGPDALPDGLAGQLCCLDRKQTASRRRRGQPQPAARSAGHAGRGSLLYE